MNKFFIIFIILLQINIYGQLPSRPAVTYMANNKSVNANIIEINKTGVTESYYSPQELVENVLVTNCVSITNFSAVVHGTPNQNLTKSYGYFHRTPGSTFPFEEGIVLTNGNAYDGGNTLTGIMPSNDNSMGGDPDLEAALGTSNTYDRTVFEFDFVALSNEVSFNFLMASSEYHIDWPCTYSDGFAFLIKPVGGTSYTNLALVPGTNTPIACTTVHTDVDETGTPLPCGAINENYFEGFQIGDTNYMGRTLVFTAQSAVIPGNSYHIKMVVADQLDSVYDTAIFLEGNSFGFFEVNILDENGNILPDSIDICYPDPLPQLQVTPIAGSTYQWQLNGVDIPGATSPVLDITEGGEYTIIVNNPYCQTLSDTIIVNYYDMTVEIFDDVEACDSFTLPPLNAGNYYTQSGGNGTQYQPGDVLTDSQTIYIYNSNGICEDESSFQVTIIPTPVVDQLDDVDVCDSYTLPDLNVGEYYTEPGGNGTQYQPGDIIETTQTIYIYAANGECWDESSFTVNITLTPLVDEFADVHADNEYTMPQIVNGEFFTEPMGQGTQLFPGDVIYETTTVYVFAANGDCYNQTEFTIYITDKFIYPHFFTPNGDRYNDTWEIETQKLVKENTPVYIYDRYGKLLKIISTGKVQWDGTYNGKLLPATDYWFSIELITGEIFTAHFSLKR